VSGRVPLAICHDYLTQRGGAERVVLTLASNLPGTPVHTAFYDADGTYAGFADIDVRTLPLDRVGPLRRHHRAAMPLLAPAFSRHVIDAEVTVCSSSGWAHGVATTGAKLVYCYTPARWLYQSDRYLRGASPPARALLAALGPPLRRWDARAAARADRYLAISSVVRDRIRRHYGIDADIVHPPSALDASGPVRPVAGIEPGFYLCVSRLLAYKNVDVLVDAFASLERERLVVVGTGPLAGPLAARAGSNVTFVGDVDDDELRWLYRSAAGLLGASYEDFGLTPVEAAAQGTPSAVLRYGGYLDTVEDGVTGVFFDRPEPDAVAGAVRTLSASELDPEVVRRRAARFDVETFLARIGAEVDGLRHRS
jgi:glycosyltransferase involved in cell wall biosynthesis